MSAVWAAGHSYGVHRDCHPDPVMSLGPTWATATGWSTVEDWMGAQLSARWGAAGAEISIKTVYALRCAR
jgi:hypothetical protein